MSAGIPPDGAPSPFSAQKAKTAAKKARRLDKALRLGTRRKSLTGAKKAAAVIIIAML